MKRLCALVLILLASATIVHAQDYLGSIRGTVYDSDGAVIPNASITVESPALMGTRTITSSKLGAYRIVNLPPGEYTIKVSAPDYRQYEQKGIVVSAGKVVGLNINLEIGSFEQTIVVTGQAPIIDPTETGQKFNISGEFHRSLPISVRNEAFEILTLIPGAVQSETSQDYAYFSVHGADQTYEPPAWDIDGANATGQEQGLMTTRINLDIIEDTSIDITKTSAVYASGQSGAVRIITKSGGNELSGTLAFQYQPQQWNDINIDEGSPADTRFYQGSATLGGPVIKDKLWFFGSFRYQEISDGISRTQESINRMKQVFPDFEPFRNTLEQPDAFGKLSFHPAENHDFFISYQQEWGGSVLAGGKSLESALIHEDSSGYYVNSNWNWAVNNDLIVTTSASYTTKPRKRFYDDNTKTGEFYYMYASTGGGSGNISGTDLIVQDGVIESYYEQEDQGLRIRSDATWFASLGKSTHDVQFGMLLEPILRNQRIELNETTPRTINYVANDPNDLSKGFTPFSRKFFTEAESPGLDTRVQRYAFYINDSWQLNDRLVVQAGLRYTLSKGEDELDNDVFSTPWAKALSPNIGASYALTDDKKTIARASFSRHYNNIIAGALPTSSRYQSAPYYTEYDNDLDGVFETVVPFTPATLNVESVEWGDVDLLGYSDDFSFGASRELPWDMTISADYIYRETGGGLAWIWNAIIEDGVWQGPIVPHTQYNEFMTPVENTYNWQTFQGLDITLNKAMSDNLQFLMAYSYGDGHLEGTYTPDDPLYYLQPETFPMQTTLVNHSARINVVYLAPYDIVVGVTGSITQGQLSQPLLLLLDGSSPDFFAHGPPVIFDPAIMATLSNPLFSPVRRPGEDRDEGRWRGETTYNWNLRVGKSFNIMDRYRLEAAVDIYNVFNAGSHPWDNRGMILPYNAQFTGELSTGTYQRPRAAKATIKLSF